MPDLKKTGKAGAMTMNTISYFEIIPAAAYGHMTAGSI